MCSLLWSARVKIIFGSRLPFNGIVETVLYHLIELSRCWGVAVVVVRTFCINVCYLLPDTAFTGTNASDSLQQLAEIVFSKYSLALFQTLIIQHKPFTDIFIQYLRGLDAKLRCTCRGYTIAYGDNHVKIVKINLFLNLASNASIYDGCNFCNCRVLT